MKPTRPILLLLAMFVTGCAAEPMMVPAARMPPPREVSRAPAAALAFTPTIGQDENLDLDRDGRHTYATAGYESQVVSETYVRQDDRFRTDRLGDDGYFERRAISTTVTVRQR